MAHGFPFLLVKWVKANLKDANPANAEPSENRLTVANGTIGDNEFQKVFISFGINLPKSRELSLSFREQNSQK
ncbi:hypothetical protein VNO77_19162 [Canavalia gladiata]|uniref:Uncharacterized protein n=1 Tax=Canavalia gladiata TaxID=3824 RepID=A0AAN9LQV5_CANGL